MSAPGPKLYMEDLDRRRVPMSTGIIARWLMKAGMDSTAADDYADRVVGDLVTEFGDTCGPTGTPVRRDTVFTGIATVLLADGLVAEERRVRVRRWVRTSGQPLVIAIGGSSGVGKSTVSRSVADRLGISAVISTDEVRAVVRSILEPNLLPTLHESSFSAAKMLRSNLTGNRLLFAYEEQARIVQHATFALVRRSLKEGQQIVVNGVHVVPGLVEVTPGMPLFTYVLTVPDTGAHRGRFIQRFLAGDRKPTEYLQRIDAIRELDAYIVEQCQRFDVPVIVSTTFDQTVLDTMDAICHDLEQRFDTDTPGSPRTARTTG